MSTILNALKKLDQESLAEETEHPPALNLHLRQEKHLWKEKTFWRSGRINSLPWAVLPALLLLGGFVCFSLVTDRFQGKTLPAQKAPMVPPMQASPEKETARPANPDPQKTAQTPVQKPKRPLTARPAKPVEAPPRKTIARAISERTETAEKTKTPKKPERTETAGMPSQPVSDRDTTVAEKNSARDREVPLLGEGRLKINAISWSQRADERLAVINSAIVREGQTVEGFRLVRIMEDGVIVQRAGQKHRVEFSLR